MSIQDREALRQLVYEKAQQKKRTEKSFIKDTLVTALLRFKTTHQQTKTTEIPTFAESLTWHSNIEVFSSSTLWRVSENLRTASNRKLHSSYAS